MPILRHVWAHSFEDKADMISVWATVFELVQQTEKMIRARLGCSISPYILENI